MYATLNHAEFYHTFSNSGNVNMNQIHPACYRETVAIVEVPLKCGRRAVLDKLSDERARKGKYPYCCLLGKVRETDGLNKAVHFVPYIKLPSWTGTDEALLDSMTPGEVLYPVAWESLNQEEKAFQAMKMSIHAAMVDRVDQEAGRVIDWLKSIGKFENTVIFFLSDNGGPETKNGSDNGPLREGKSSTYEGGYRVPFALQWKGELKAGTFDAPVSAMDIFATISELSEAPGNPGHPLDGVNLIPYLKGEKDGVPHETIYLRKFDGKKFAVRHGDYKLLSFNNNTRQELYHLGEDIGEENDLAATYPGIVYELDSLREEWNSELIDPAFLGLIHTEEWINKLKRAKKK